MSPPNRRSNFPLTDFILALDKTTPEQRNSADPEKLAAKYGIRPQDDRGYLDMARG